MLSRDRVFGILACYQRMDPSTVKEDPEVLAGMVVNACFKGLKEDVSSLIPHVNEWITEIRSGMASNRVG